MGRGKLKELTKSDYTNSREVAYTKAREDLFEKARELAILCDAEVAVIIFSNTGKIAEFASTNMQQILTRYRTLIEMNQGPAVELKLKEPKVVDDLKEEISNLKAKKLTLLGKDLTDMGLQELRTLERGVNEMLLYIYNRKEQMLMQQLEQSRMQQQQTMLEIEALRRKVDILQGSTSTPSTSYAGVAAEVSDPSLQLGLSSGIDLNMEPSDSEIQPSGPGGSFSYHPPNPPFD